MKFYPSIPILILGGVLWISIASCSRQSQEGPVEITWDRDTCEYCRMVISDRGFAAQLRDADKKVHKFDDLGCLVNWLEKSDWTLDNVQAWVADHRHSDDAHWLNVKTAKYVPGQSTPMDYGYGAADESTSNGVDFETARRAMLNKDASR